MKSDLMTLKNIGPASASQLRDVGIETAAQLRKIGALDAYRRLKHAFPRHVSLLMLYALEGALRDCHWNRLPAGVKERLRQATSANQKPAAR
jgi:DNA transformation protein and related proteins